MDDIMKMAVENNQESWDDYASQQASLLASLYATEYDSEEYLNLLDGDPA